MLGIFATISGSRHAIGSPDHVTVLIIVNSYNWRHSYFCLCEGEITFSILLKNKNSRKVTKKVRMKEMKRNINENSRRFRYRLENKLRQKKRKKNEKSKCNKEEWRKNVMKQKRWLLERKKSRKESNKNTYGKG